ncbi:MAG TPA: hypothetical protein VFB82_23140, partial [Blastocatellia bacterium]|nr:hypothetical protein [Blastocatellia bacterium]
NEGAHYWTAEELTKAAIQFVAIQIGIVLIVWLVPSNQIGFREAVHSIAITNTALSLLIVLYATVVAWELHWSARYLSVSPFKNIGFFTQYISIGFGVCMLVVVIVNKLRARVSS